ncbi:MM3350-like domain-containing protein, partial [Podospora australis]
FEALHHALQAAFGWATVHTYDFTVKDPNFRPPADMMEAMQQMIHSHGDEPLLGVSRLEYLLRLRDPHSQNSIDSMHECKRRHPNTVEKNVNKPKLWQVLDDPAYEVTPGKGLEYTYDFGDNWVHDITIEGRADANELIEVLRGEGHPIAEDVGGWKGWNELKEAYNSTRPNREQRDKMRWFERKSANADLQGLRGDRSTNGIWRRFNNT